MALVAEAANDLLIETNVFKQPEEEMETDETMVDPLKPSFPQVSAHEMMVCTLELAPFGLLFKC